MLHLLVGIGFAGLHAVAWSFSFPTELERWLWRMSTIAIAVYPTSIALSTVIFYVKSLWDFGPSIGDIFHSLMIGTKSHERASIVLTSIGVPLYVIARLILLGLLFSTLRDLPPSAYQAVRWTSYIPHIG